ncbi:MAG TPA: hypothetical protein PLG17_11570, partial [Thermodesulfobacteriota bacterium]|nr:hypothetical protein [Thermodesulfobacteriota bacterium]
QGASVSAFSETLSPHALKQYQLTDLTGGQAQEGGSIEITATQAVAASALFIQGSGIVALPVESMPVSAQ